MKRGLFNLTSILVLLLAVTGAANAAFDMTSASASDKVAASKQFSVTNGQVNTFDLTNLSRPIATTASGTMLVQRIQSTTAVSIVAAVPDHFELSQNFPNPFNMSTKIVYSVPSSSHVSLIVYDIVGREIASLVNGPMTAGTHTVNFSKMDIASGTYFYRLTAVDQSGAMNVEMKKMILLK